MASYGVLLTFCPTKQPHKFYPMLIFNRNSTTVQPTMTSTNSFFPFSNNQNHSIHWSVGPWGPRRFVHGLIDACLFIHRIPRSHWVQRIFTGLQLKSLTHLAVEIQMGSQEESHGESLSPLRTGIKCHFWWGVVYHFWTHLDAASPRIFYSVEAKMKLEYVRGILGLGQTYHNKSMSSFDIANSWWNFGLELPHLPKGPLVFGNFKATEDNGSILLQVLPSAAVQKLIWFQWIPLDPQSIPFPHFFHGIIWPFHLFPSISIHFHLCPSSIFPILKAVFTKLAPSFQPASPIILRGVAHQTSGKPCRCPAAEKRRTDAGPAAATSWQIDIADSRAMECYGPFIDDLLYLYIHLYIYIYYSKCGIFHDFPWCSITRGHTYNTCPF